MYGHLLVWEGIAALLLLEAQALCTLPLPSLGRICALLPKLVLVEVQMFSELRISSRLASCILPLQDATSFAWNIHHAWLLPLLSSLVLAFFLCTADLLLD